MLAFDDQVGGFGQDLLTQQIEHLPFFKDKMGTKYYKNDVVTITGGGSGDIIIYHNPNKRFYIKKFFYKNTSKFNEQKRNAQIINKTKLDCLPKMSVPVDDVILMENKFKHGITLQEFLKSSELSNRKIIKLARNMINCMKILHSKGIAHGDIKASNILVDPKTLNIQFIDMGSLWFKNQPTQDPYSIFKSTIQYLPKKYRNIFLQHDLNFEKMVYFDQYAMGKLLEQIERKYPSVKFISDSKEQFLVQQAY
jgi:serine/threonine protein kinase